MLADTPPIDVRPAPFSEYTTPEFWNDPHVSAPLLHAQVSCRQDAAGVSSWWR